MFQNLNLVVGRHDGYLAQHPNLVSFRSASMPLAFTLVRREVCPKKITEHTQFLVNYRLHASGASALVIITPPDKETMIQKEKAEACKCL